MEYYNCMRDEHELELYHHGVKGMKWGLGKLGTIIVRLKNNLEVLPKSIKNKRAASEVSALAA